MITLRLFQRNLTRRNFKNIIKGTNKNQFVSKAQIQRNFFNRLFGKKRVKEAPTTVIDKRKENLEFEQANNAQENTELSEKEQFFIEKRNQYFTELRKHREEYEDEVEKRKREVEDATLRARREYEVTIKNLDYRKIILDNLTHFKNEEFESFEELMEFMGALEYKLTEENMNKALLGFLNFSVEMEESDLQRQEFLFFLDLIRSDIGFMTRINTYMNFARFLDLYCVDYPEIWVKFEKKILENIDQFELKEKIEIIEHFSNQGEGSDRFYDQMEKDITPSLTQLEAEELTKLIQSYYNVKRGTKELFKALFKAIEVQMSSDDFNNMDAITKMSLIMGETDELIDFVKDLYVLMEKITLRNLDDLSMEKVCLIAFGFGSSHGTKLFFDKLERKAAENFQNFTFEELKLILHGFVFTYRITPIFLKKLLKKTLGFQNQLSPIEMAKLLRGLYVLEIKDKEIKETLDNHILMSLQNFSHFISNEHLFEICLSYNMSRDGTREMFKTLEFVFKLRLENMGKEEPELLRKFHALFSNSGLISAQTLQKIEKHL